ncbi:MAG: ATP-binding protein [Haliscomenobacteraceae bacterium CHB4]|nr:hypothetical protein [Saprospiraceae bacterium]MCE7923830.1 ATP-binding protein [Haliscomenobacteraceae bacterium CHB4]
MSDKPRRYPGLNYFKESQQGQFFGRDDEIEDLQALIATEKIVVLFGKSGYGKSSLLRAGVLPRLKDIFTPIVVQLGAYQPQSLSPVAKSLAQLDAVVPNRNTASDFMEDISDRDTLWHQFKVRQNAGKGRFLLVFDQFEEFDSYPAIEKTTFKQQIAELLYTRIPQNIRDQSDTLTGDQLHLLAVPLDVKIVFIIREDRLSVLDGLTDKIPNVLHKRFRLRQLTDAQAREAIEKPAALKHPPDSSGGAFESPVFYYSPDAVTALINGLKKESLTGAGAEHIAGVESFLLQVYCENIEKMVIGRHRKGNGENIVIAPADLPPFDRLFEDYYNNKIEALPNADEREAVRRMIEDELVKVDPASGIAYRMSADSRRLTGLPFVNDALLKRLIDDFLLRSEPNTTGGFNYEISHDTLVAPVLKAKEQRQRMEQAAEEARQRKEQEIMLAKERQKRRKATILAVCGFLLAAISLGATFIAIEQSRQAKKAKTKAENALLDLNHALFNDLQERAEIIVFGNSCPMELVEKMREIARNYPEQASFQTKLNAIETTIAQKNLCPR